VIQETLPKGAEWWRRLIGFIIDALPLMIIIRIMMNDSGDSHMRYLLFVLVYIPYCILFEGIFKRTFGKLITGTIVVSSDIYKKPSFEQILGRSFLRLIPFEAFTFISNRPKGWHDLISHTMVITIKERRSYFNVKKRNHKSILFSKIISRLKTNKGVFRLIVVGSGLIPIIISIIVGITVQWENAGTFFLWLLLTILIYWIFIFIGLWIYDGFRTDKKEILVENVNLATEILNCNDNNVSNDIKDDEIVEVVHEQDKSKKNFGLFLILLYVISIGIAYLIVTFEKQNDYNEINQQIESIFKQNKAIAYYTIKNSNEGKLYNIYISHGYDYFNLHYAYNFNTRSVQLTGDSIAYDYISTKTISLAGKPHSLAILNDSISAKPDFLKEWNFYKSLIQYYVCSGGFDVFRLEKDSSTFSISEYWSGNMAYKVIKDRPSVNECYASTAKYFALKNGDSTLLENGYNRIISFLNITSIYYKIQQYPEGEYRNGTHYYKDNNFLNYAYATNENNTDKNFDSQITSYLYNSKYVIWWHQRIINNYIIKEKENVFNEYWMYTSIVFIIIITLLFFGIKYHERN
jgi:uncharacterized RDD family membrane protein YckC